MCYYHTKHELASVDNQRYNAVNFYNLSELPEVISYTNNQGQDHQTYKISALIGTVIDADNSKHLVSISTIYGVVNVKFFINAYNQFNQKISQINAKTQKKSVLDDSWFKRGTKIIVYGFRKENTFIAKTSYDTGYPRTVGIIERIIADGSLDIRYKRKTE